MGRPSVARLCRLGGLHYRELLRESAAEFGASNDDGLDALHAIGGDSHHGREGAFCWARSGLATVR